MLPDSNIARSFPRLAGTLTTSTPVALVKGSKMVLTTASSYAPPMVRTTILPAAPARRTHTNGAAPAARPAALARKPRRVTPAPGPPLRPASPCSLIVASPRRRLSPPDAHEPHPPISTQVSRVSSGRTARPRRRRAADHPRVEAPGRPGLPAERAVV